VLLEPILQRLFFQGSAQASMTHITSRRNGSHKAANGPKCGHFARENGVDESTPS